MFYARVNKNMCNELKKCILHLFLVLAYYSASIEVRGERNFGEEFESALEFHRRLHEKFLTSRHFRYGTLRTTTTATPQAKKINKKPIILNKFYKTFAAILRSLDDHDLMTVVQAADDEIREGDEENKPLLKSHFAKDPFIMELTPPTAIRNLDLDTPEYFSFVQDVNEYYKKRFAAQKELKELYRNITNIFVREMEREFDDKDNSKKDERHLDAGVKKKLVEIVRNAVSIFKTHPSINNRTRDQIHLTLKTLWDDLRENAQDVEKDEYTEKASKSPKAPRQVVFRYSLGDLLNLVNFMLESEIWQRSAIANSENLNNVPKKFKEPLAAQFLQFDSIEVTSPTEDSARRMKKRIEVKSLRADNNEDMLTTISAVDNFTTIANTSTNTSTPLLKTSSTVASTSLYNSSSSLKEIERRATQWVEWKFLRTRPHALQLFWENSARIDVVGDEEWKRKSRLRSQTKSMPDAGFKVPFSIISQSVRNTSQEPPKAVDNFRKHSEKPTNLTAIAKYLSETLPHLIEEPYDRSQQRSKSNKKHKDKSKHLNEIATYLSETLPKLIEESSYNNYKKKHNHNEPTNVRNIEEYISQKLPKLIGKPPKRSKTHKDKNENITVNRNIPIHRKRERKKPVKVKSKIKIKVPVLRPKGFKKKIKNEVKGRGNHPDSKREKNSGKRGKHSKQHKNKRKTTKTKLRNGSKRVKVSTPRKTTTTRKSSRKMRKKRTKPLMTVEYFLSAKTSTTRMKTNQSSSPKKALRKKTPRKLRYFSFNKTGKYRADEDSSEGLAIEVMRSQDAVTPDLSKTIWHKEIVYSDSGSHGISIEVNEPLTTSKKPVPVKTETTVALVKFNISTVPTKTLTVNNQTKKSTAHTKTTKMKVKRKKNKKHISRNSKTKKGSSEDYYDGMSIEVTNVTKIFEITNSSNKNQSTTQSSVKTTKRLETSKTHVTTKVKTTKKYKSKHAHKKIVVHKILASSKTLRYKHSKHDSKHEGISIEVFNVLNIPLISNNSIGLPKNMTKQSNVTTTKLATTAAATTKATKTIKNQKKSRKTDLDSHIINKILKSNNESRRNENSTVFKNIANETITDNQVKNISNSANVTYFYQDFIDLINKMHKVRAAEEVVKMATLHHTTTKTPSTTQLINLIQSLLHNSNQVVDIVMKTNNQTANRSDTGLGQIEDFDEVNFKAVRRSDNSSLDISDNNNTHVVNATDNTVQYYTEIYYVYDSVESEAIWNNTGSNRTFTTKIETTLFTNATTSPVNLHNSVVDH